MINARNKLKEVNDIVDNIDIPKDYQRRSLFKSAKGSIKDSKIDGEDNGAVITDDDDDIPIIEEK